MKYVRPSMKHHVSQGTKTLLLWRTWRNVTRFTRRVARMLSTTVTDRSQKRFAPISQSRSATLSPKLSLRSFLTQLVKDFHLRPVHLTTVNLCLDLPSVTIVLLILELINQKRFVTSSLRRCANRSTDWFQNYILKRSVKKFQEKSVTQA